MHPSSSKGSVHGRRPPYSGKAPERAPLRAALRALPGVQDRALFVLGVISLLVVVPGLWLWIAYGSSLSPALIWMGGLGLSAMTAGIGLAMIRMLDGKR
jgi:hypothetical protein